MWIIGQFSHLVTKSVRQNGLLCERIYEYILYEPPVYCYWLSSLQVLLRLHEKYIWLCCNQRT